MAVDRHIELLCRGAEAWNAERRARPFIPDLTHIEIRDTVLSGIDLSGADLDGCGLRGVDLRQASLAGARVNGVSASRVRLSGADLRGAEFKGTDLKRVSLEGAALGGAVGLELKLRHSDVRRASFAQAELRLAHFYNCDIRGIDLAGARLQQTFLKRVVLDPEVAQTLQGLGIEAELADRPNREDWVDWDGFDVRGGADYGVIIHRGRAHWVSEGRWDFFISHASVDKAAVAGPLAAALRRRGRRVWYDESTIHPNDDLEKVIRFGLRGSLFGVAIVSPAFFGRRWTDLEFEALRDKHVYLVLHEMTPEQLAERRPELAARRLLSSGMGMDIVADQLVDAIERPPAEL